MPTYPECPRILRTINTTIETKNDIPVKSGETFYAGQTILAISGPPDAGKLIVIPNGYGSAKGITLSDSTHEVTGDPVTYPLYQQFYPEQDIEISVYHSNPANAVTTQDLVGRDFGVKTITTLPSGTKKSVLDLENTAQPLFRVTGISPRYPLGERYGTVIVRVLNIV